MSFVPAVIAMTASCFGKTNTVLSKSAIASIMPAAATPELVTVTLCPIAFGILSIGDLARRGCLNPLGWNQLLSVPHAFLQVQLPELSDIFGSNIEAIATEANSLRAVSPSRFFDAQWLEQTWFEVVEYGLAGLLLNDSGQHVGRWRVVHEVFAWSVNDGLSQKALVQMALGPRRASLVCPVDIVSKSRTRIALRFSLASDGTSSGKKLTTRSSTLSFPSATARPTAVDVKLLLSE